MGSSLEKIAKNAWHWLSGAGKPRHHWRRYILGGFVSVAGIVALAAAYMMLAPRVYTSDWGVILPGAGVEARFALDRIGQTQLSAASPFSDKALSPKVNYKEISLSRPVLEMAAKTMGISLEQFGTPKIKLIDQSSLMWFEVKAASPEDAQARARAHLAALRKMLDDLRADEIRWRNQAIRDTVGEIEGGLKAARERLLELQIGSGLASIEQYNQLVQSIEALKRDEASAKAQLAERHAQVAALGGQLGLDATAAARLIGLSADPEFKRLWQAYAEASSTLAQNALRFGPTHPRVMDPRGKMDSIAAVLREHLAARGITSSEFLNDAILSSDNDRVLALMTDLISRSTERAGLVARVDEIGRLLVQHETRRQELGIVAARLDDLQRDHSIANAVFSSAMARIDSTKSDIFASYPLLQVLQEPTLPEKPSSPRLLFAAVGAVGGSFLASTAWIFAWLHQWFAFARSRRRSFTMRYA